MCHATPPRSRRACCLLCPCASALASSPVSALPAGPWSHVSIYRRSACPSCRSACPSTTPRHATRRRDVLGADCRAAARGIAGRADEAGAPSVPCIACPAAREVTSFVSCSIILLSATDAACSRSWKHGSRGYTYYCSGSYTCCVSLAAVSHYVSHYVCCVPRLPTGSAAVSHCAVEAQVVAAFRGARRRRKAHRCTAGHVRERGCTCSSGLRDKNQATAARAAPLLHVPPHQVQRPGAHHVPCWVFSLLNVVAEALRSLVRHHEGVHAGHCSRAHQASRHVLGQRAAPRSLGRQSLQLRAQGPDLTRDPRAE